MEKKVLKEILAMDKKELRNLVEEQGDKIDLGIYLFYIWEDLKNGLIFKHPRITKPFLEISKRFNEFGWTVKDFLEKRAIYKFTDYHEDMPICVSDFLKRINPKLKFESCYDMPDVIVVKLKDNRAIHVDKFEFARHIDYVRSKMYLIEGDAFEIYKYLH